jgi:hypothetical protein
MAKYKVVRPVEHNRKLYMPATALSAADGTQIEVDASGFIQLGDDEASQFGGGQIEPTAEETSGGESGSPAAGSSRRGSSKS